MQTISGHKTEGMENTATIEVNGKYYDAVTGVLLDQHKPSSAPPLSSHGRNIDGFFRARTVTPPRATISRHTENDTIINSAPEIRDVVAMKPKLKRRRPSADRAVNHTRAHTPQTAKARAIEVSHAVSKSHTLDVRRGQPNHIHHRAQQRTQTLRRDSVPVPKLSTHNLLKPQGELQRKASGLINLKKSAVNVDTDRLARAQTITTSPLVTHHANTGRGGVSPTFVSVTVQPTPAPYSTTTSVQTQPSRPGSVSQKPTRTPKLETDPLDIFEHALANANNFVDVREHRAHYRHKAHIHIASMAMGTLALLIIAGFVTFQNTPSLQLKLASLKAGVSASVPDLTTTGLVYNGVRAGDGRLTLGLKGLGGVFQLTQEDTDLSDTDMIGIIGSTDASGAPMYTALQAGTVTVYRFNNTGATWVNGGKWYTLSGTAALSDSQVKDLVQHI
ncbi:MAG TPA: hypothetical protein VMB52_03460 [Verrucomicrobiae bacterium]|nr:hypothetical protein [Verrucomicrobiae bacterium]